MSLMSSPSNFAGDVFTVGAPCGSAGGAMYDPPSTTPPPKMPTGEHCFLLTAAPVVIGDTFMTVNDGFKHVNWVFHTCGDQPCCPNQYGLPQGGLT